MFKNISFLFGYWFISVHKSSISSCAEQGALEMNSRESHVRKCSQFHFPIYQVAIWTILSKIKTLVPLNMKWRCDACKDSGHLEESCLSSSYTAAQWPGVPKQQARMALLHIHTSCSFMFNSENVINMHIRSHPPVNSFQVLYCTRYVSGSFTK